MTSIDQESLRRKEAERRIAAQNDTSGRSATWFLGIVALVAVIGGILLLGTGGDTPTDPAAPAAVEQVAPPATDGTEGVAPLDAAPATEEAAPAPADDAAAPAPADDAAPAATDAQ